MIKKLQRKFIKIAMLSFFIVLFVIISAINLTNFYQMTRKIDGILEILAENDGRFPGMEKDRQKPPKPLGMGYHFTEETPYETRYFTVKFNQKGEIEEINTSHIAAVSSKDAQNYALRVLQAGKKQGYQSGYKFLLVEKDEQGIIIFLDCHQELSMTASLFLWSIIIMLISLGIVFCLISIFSKKAISPVIESIEKQKQFITDAGHEIKTPLAIISANVDVLELTEGENEWILSIRNQVQRLTELVKNLLAMARMEEIQRIEFHKFCFNDIIKEEVKPFEILAESQNKTIKMELNPSLFFKGEEKSIRQLINILVDNAIKYSIEGEEIHIKLKQLKKGIQLEINNIGENIPTENLNQLFDRFYRADTSRARQTGGYGIGLAMAQAIVQRHNGKIWAECRDGKKITIYVFM